ncbi:FadR/GntR family transcriptional regulator [Microbacterium sp.]|uniref:FadR/GntR family transcriptional regulator n=1 Tax=Microbacterium sp. TaxID=51671 RepID=UPI003A8F139B
MPAYPGDDSTGITAALGTIDSASPVSEVTRRLLDLFTSGSIEPGTRLPPERRLAATLGVGRSAVREALASLEILGIVSVKPGSGTYLRGTASDLLPNTLSWGLLIGRQRTDELLELRAGLEIYVARLAAVRESPPDLTRLTEAIDDMRAAIGDLSAFADADRAFHDAVAVAAGNGLLIDQLHVVRNLLQVYAGRAVASEADARRAQEEHEAVHAAIVRRDGDAAASAMAAHMTTAALRLAAVDRPG